MALTEERITTRWGILQKKHEPTPPVEQGRDLLLVRCLPERQPFGEKGIGGKPESVDPMVHGHELHPVSRQGPDASR